MIKWLLLLLVITLLGVTAGVLVYNHGVPAKDADTLIVQLEAGADLAALQASVQSMGYAEEGVSQIQIGHAWKYQHWYGKPILSGTSRICLVELRSPKGDTLAIDWARGDDLHAWFAKHFQGQ